MCRTLGVNRTSFRDWERRAPSDRALSDAWLTPGQNPPFPDSHRAEQVLSDGTRMLVLALERDLPAEAGGPRRRAITPCIKINPADGGRRQTCRAACCTNGADA